MSLVILIKRYDLAFRQAVIHVVKSIVSTWGQWYSPNELAINGESVKCKKNGMPYQKAESFKNWLGR